MGDGSAPVPRRRDLRRTSAETSPSADGATTGEPAADRFPRSADPAGPAAPGPAAPAAAAVPAIAAAPDVPVAPEAPVDSGANERVAHRQVPVEHRRRWIAVTLTVVILAVAVVTGGPWVYARVMADSPAEPLALSTPTQAPSNDPLVPLALDGTWRVTEPSQAGYRIGEVLAGKALEVVGRTDEVTGTVTVNGKVLTDIEVVVRAGTITTDESARDAFFLRALDTTTYPEASFTSTGPVEVGEVSTSTAPVTVEVPGVLELRDKTLEVVATVQVQRTKDGIEAVGSIIVPLSDLGLTAPNLGFVTVDETGSVEFQITLAR